MQGIRPCPYCGGEVEMVRLNRKKANETPAYRLSCYQCRAVVARGTGFPQETDEEKNERIRQYEEEVAKKYSTPSSTIFRQSIEAKNRDRLAKNAGRYERE